MRVAIMQKSDFGFKNMTALKVLLFKSQKFWKSVIFTNPHSPRL